MTVPPHSAVVIAEAIGNLTNGTSVEFGAAAATEQPSLAMNLSCPDISDEDFLFLDNFSFWVEGVLQVRQKLYYLFPCSSLATIIVALHKNKLMAILITINVTRSSHQFTQDRVITNFEDLVFFIRLTLIFFIQTWRNHLLSFLFQRLFMHLGPRCSIRLVSPDSGLQ
jgi:hypothetical protein